MSPKDYYHNSRSPNALIRPHSSWTHRRLAQKSWLKRYCRFIYLKFLRLRGKPVVVARGLAVGVFAGCFPFFGFQSLVGIFLATLFHGSKVAAIAATWISNPFTTVPIFIFNYKIGKLLLGTKDTVVLLDLKSFAAFKELGPTFAITFLTGCLVVGLILALITYFYSLAVLERLRTRRNLKLKK
jgi:uncharacterized protein